MHKLARQIVERRNLVFLFVVLATIFTVFAVKWVKVETDMTTYLPKTSETRLGLDIMEDQFTTYGSADVMVANITPDEADALSNQLTELKGVQMLDYDDTTDHYNKDSVSALYSITFDYPEEDDQCLEALDRVKEYLADYDIYVSTSLGNTQQETIDAEVRVIMVYVAVIIVVVLIFTSQTYAEVPVLILTFVVGMILNMGTNFLLGTISFVSNSVTNILQLALSLDYAIIFCNHFKEEHQTMPLKEAVIESLSKSIPEISSSSLTTIGGLVAMLFMQFKIGADMATCLIKAILFSMISVFVVMPGLLMLFGPYMDKTKHKNFVPDIPFVGRFAWRTRKIVPAIFVVVILIAYHFSSLCPYAYGYDVIKVPKMNESLIADQMIEENFTKSNLVALVYPKNDDYSVEKKMLEELESYDEIDHTQGLSNIEAQDGYMLEDKLTARQFSEMADLDYEAAQLVYTAYAIENEEYGQIIGNFASYRVPLVECSSTSATRPTPASSPSRRRNWMTSTRPGRKWRAHWLSCRATSTTASSSTSAPRWRPARRPMSSPIPSAPSPGSIPRTASCTWPATPPTSTISRSPSPSTTSSSASCPSSSSCWCCCSPSSRWACPCCSS